MTCIYNHLRRFAHLHVQPWDTMKIAVQTPVLHALPVVPYAQEAAMLSVQAALLEIIYSQLHLRLLVRPHVQLDTMRTRLPTFALLAPLAVLLVWAALLYNASPVSLGTTYLPQNAQLCTLCIDGCYSCSSIQCGECNTGNLMMPNRTACVSTCPASFCSYSQNNSCVGNLFFLYITCTLFSFFLSN